MADKTIRVRSNKFDVEWRYETRSAFMEDHPDA